MIKNTNECRLGKTNFVDHTGRNKNANTKNINVESIEVPKPKRERKKSKSKCEEVEDPKVDTVKGDVVEKVDNSKKMAADPGGKIESVGVSKEVGAKSPNAASAVNGAGRSPRKPESLEKGKKSPTKKIPGPAGESHD